MSHQQHTIQRLTENHVNITNYSNTHGKPCKYNESQHDQLKTWSTRNPTNCAAITTRLWAGTDEQNVLQSLREAPALKNFKLDPEKTSQRDEPEMTSSRGSPKKGRWMNSSLTSELKQTNMKKTQSVRNMNKPSIMIHLIEQERTTTTHCEDTVAPATLSLRSRCREINQI